MPRSHLQRMTAVISEFCAVSKNKALDHGFQVCGQH